MTLIMEWPVDMDILLTYQRLHDIFMTSLTSQFDLLPSGKGRVIDSLRETAAKKTDNISVYPALLSRERAPSWGTDNELEGGQHHPLLVGWP